VLLLATLWATLESFVPNALSADMEALIPLIINIYSAEQKIT
jgi:hypothetical protein